MWAGVTKGLAGRKLSGSPNEVGQNRATASKDVSMIIKPKISLTL